MMPTPSTDTEDEPALIVEVRQAKMTLRTNSMKSPVPSNRIEQVILLIRGQRVILSL